MCLCVWCGVWVCVGVGVASAAFTRASYLRRYYLRYDRIFITVRKMDFCRIIKYILLLIFRSHSARFHAMFLRKIQSTRERGIMVWRQLQAQ